jgi:putative glutamine amidotransferase
MPVLIPAVGSKVDVSVVLSRLDGLMLTGSPSNVHPSHYGAEPSDHEILYDRERDATTLALIREAIRLDLPILAICCGIQVMVNSLHSQGIDRPALRLRVEAVAPDGQIEAVSLPGARFVVGVQWHPEYKVMGNPFSIALFSTFAEACGAAGMGFESAVRAA